MILDTIENSFLYTPISHKIAKGLNYIQETDLENTAVGKYDLGDGITAIISEYETKLPENAKPEAHEKYLDIQYIIKGKEQIGFAPLEGQVPSVPYSEEKDLVFYDVETSLSTLKEGMFAIYFPTDIHQPCVMIDKPQPVKKVVVKVPVN